MKADSGIANLAGTAGKKIGVQKGTTGKSYATKNAPSTAEIVDFPSDAELWPAIQAKQIDAILQDQPVNHTHEVADSTLQDRRDHTRPTSSTASPWRRARTRPCSPPSTTS